MNDNAPDIEGIPASAKLNLKARILVPLLVVTLVLIVTVGTGFYRVEREHIGGEVSDIQHSMRQVYALSVEKRVDKLAAVLETILRNEGLLAALKSQNRQLLLNAARPLFERLQANSSISHFYFHGPDRVNLMRVHLPNEFGDLIERQSLLMAESTGRMAHGVELGPFGTFTVRAVAPWYDGASLVGYVELGSGMEDMVEILRQTFGVVPYMVISKQYMMRDRWEGIRRKLGKPVAWDLLPESVIIAGPEAAPPAAFRALLASQPIEADFGGTEIVDGERTYITGDVGLRDAAGRDVGKLVMLVETTGRLNDLRNEARIMGTVAAILGGLLLIAFYMVLNKTERLFTVSHRRIIADGHAREQMQQEHITELERLALYDPLTDLPNRQLLHDRIDHAIKTALREKHPIALALLDLNRLREINSTLGHQAGDMVLEQIAGRLRESTRASDTVARLGGDEFAILMPRLDPTFSQLAVEKLQSVLEAAFDVEEIPLSVSASFGLAFYPHDSHDAYHLLQHADVAMREARRLHRGIVVYDAERDPYSLRKLKLFIDLKNAFINDEMFLEYQPKADMKDPHNTTQVEALVRWLHPTEGLIPPNEFVPLLENTALIKTLTLNVLNEALEQCSKWKERGVDMTVSINVSMFDLLTAEVSEHIDAALRRYGLTPNNLMLEITESVIMEEPDTTIQVLTRLDGMGIRLAIDDFGTGYSSLAYIQQLPVTELKIDQSFISKLRDNHNDQTIVRSTIQLAHNLGLIVVAEGVDDEATWNVLEAMGCDVVQGFYVSRPMRAQDFGNWLHDGAGRRQLKLASLPG
jgi:diguanylate cyclase (GGDEF)-like protein